MVNVSKRGEGRGGEGLFVANYSKIDGPIRIDEDTIIKVSFDISLRERVEPMSFVASLDVKAVFDDGRRRRLRRRQTQREGDRASERERATERERERGGGL